MGQNGHLIHSAGIEPKHFLSNFKITILSVKYDDASYVISYAWLIKFCCEGLLHLSSISTVEVISYLFVSLALINGSHCWD